MSWNRLVVYKRYIMLEHTTNLHGILMLHLAMTKNIKEQSLELFGDEEYGVPLPI